MEQARVLDELIAPAAGPAELDARTPFSPAAQALIAPACVCAAMLAVACATCWLAHVGMTRLFLSYFSVSFGVTVLALLVSLFCWVAAMAMRGDDAPLRQVLGRLQSRGPLLLLPLLVLPLFLVGYTAAKTAIPFLVGFGWDGFWTGADRAIFGDDAWRIAQRWLGLGWMPFYSWFYTMVWGGAFMGVTSLVAINAGPRRAGQFYTAMLLTWLVGGWLMAMIFSAAGPVFAHLADPAVGHHFATLAPALAAHLPADDSLRLTQTYLAASLGSHVALKGGGISAMPSMHLGAAAIYVLAARGTKWLAPAVLFWLTIFFLSAYFGYHYWVDGIVAAGVAAVCWMAAERMLGRGEESAVGESNRAARR